jgi:anti-repressor protein
MSKLTKLTAPRIFNFSGMEVRVFDRAGDPWFLLTDVCRPLDIRNTSMAASRLDPEDKTTLSSTEGANINGLTPGASAPVIVNESGVYSLVLGSRKPAAKVFKRWVTSEVLPTIRRTGGYGVIPLNDPLALRAALLSYNDQVISLTADSARLPDAAAMRDLLLDFRE